MPIFFQTLRLTFLLNVFTFHTSQKGNKNIDCPTVPHRWVAAWAIPCTPSSRRSLQPAATHVTSRPQLSSACGSTLHLTRIASQPGRRTSHLMPACAGRAKLLQMEWITVPLSLCCLPSLRTKCRRCPPRINQMFNNLCNGFVQDLRLCIARFASSCFFIALSSLMKDFHAGYISTFTLDVTGAKYILQYVRPFRAWS